MNNEYDMASQLRREVELRKQQEEREQAQYRMDAEKRRAAMLEMSRHPGWRYFMEDLNDNLDAELRRAMAAPTAHEAASHAGAALAIRRVIQMPRLISAPGSAE